MERREHYDPEDIESLLQERSFDELLEEERAYVLRHLSSREEYEAMRALLHQVREDDHLREPITAGPEVRDAVMSAFRAQQRPSWQVWLNSVGTLLWPKEASAMWRPALAFATLALLIVAGVQVMRTGSETMKNQEVAEIKKEAPAYDHAEAARAGALADSMTAPDASDASLIERQPITEQNQPQGSTRFANELASAEEPVMDDAQQASVEEVDAVTTVAEDEAATNLEEDKAAKQPEQEREQDTRLSAREKRKAEASEPSAPVQTGTASHVVTAAEIVRNESTASASPRSRGLVAQQQSGSVTNLAGSPEVMALMATGW